MRLDEPSWWYGAAGEETLAARALRPFAYLYGAIAEARFAWAQPYRAACPVICIGNLTAGGTGKTPLAIFIAEYLQGIGRTPVCLSRGYGGSTAGPAWVPEQDARAADVGDEPLLLVAKAPTLIARDRRAGAATIEQAALPGTVIVMDDGLQNAALAKDLVIAVVDGRRGVGNGRVIPAGPLRADLDFQLGLVDCIVVNGGSDETGEGTGAVLDRLKHTFPGPVLAAETKPAGDVTWLEGQSVVAFAGIGHPDRFFRLLEKLGGRVVSAIPYPDHHDFTDADAASLLRAADASGAMLVTTEKDLARLSGSAGARSDLKVRSRVLPIRLAFDERDGARLTALIDTALKSQPRTGGEAQV